jgi:hypothetical protein
VLAGHFVVFVYLAVVRDALALLAPFLLAVCL